MRDRRVTLFLARQSPGHSVRGAWVMAAWLSRTHSLVVGGRRSGFGIHRSHVGGVLADGVDAVVGVRSRIPGEKSVGGDVCRSDVVVDLAGGCCGVLTERAGVVEVAAEVDHVFVDGTARRIAIVLDGEARVKGTGCGVECAQRYRRAYCR